MIFAQTVSNDSTPFEIMLSFCSLIEAEIDYRRRRNQDNSALLRYYRNLFGRNHRVNHLGAAGYAHRLMAMIEILQESGRDSLVLDAGCGYGTESYLFAGLGMEVVGIDLVADRVKMALSRIPFFKYKGIPVNKVRFHNANIFSFLETPQIYDIIWTMEAISHIHPIKPFLDLAYRRIRPGGKMIISDPNKLNPIALARSMAIRGSIRHRPHQRFFNPESGEPVNYGQENILAPGKIKRYLKQSGFRVQRLEFSGFMGSSILPDRLTRKDSFARLLVSLQSRLQRIPGIRHLGSIYTIVAEKIG